MPCHAALLQCCSAVPARMTRAASRLASRLSRLRDFFARPPSLVAHRSTAGLTRRVLPRRLAGDTLHACCVRAAEILQESTHGRIATTRARASAGGASSRVESLARALPRLRPNTPIGNFHEFLSRIGHLLSPLGQIWRDLNCRFSYRNRRLVVVDFIIISYFLYLE